MEKQDGQNYYTQKKCSDNWISIQYRVQSLVSTRKYQKKKKKKYSWLSVSDLVLTNG